MLLRRGAQRWANYTDYTQATASFAKMLGDTISAKGWGIELFQETGVDNVNYYSNWESVNQDAYYQHLDNIVNKVSSGDVWEDTVGNVSRYIDSRKAAAITYDSVTNSIIQLHVNDNLDHSLFNIPLTINTVIAASWTSHLFITHNGQEVPHTTFFDSVSGNTYASYDVLADVRPIDLYPKLPGDYNNDGLVNGADYTLCDSLGQNGTGLAADGNGDGSVEAGDFDIWRAHFGQGTAVMAPIAGDYNGNGVIDAADYVVLRNGLGTTYTEADYDVWRAHFGQTAGGGSGATANAAVPEPTTLPLLILAAAVWCLRRQRSASTSSEKSSMRETRQAMTVLETVWLSVPKPPPTTSF